jgi:hypothetical protein
VAKGFDKRKGRESALCLVLDIGCGVCIGNVGNVAGSERLSLGSGHSSAGTTEFPNGECGIDAG